MKSGVLRKKRTWPILHTVVGLSQVLVLTTVMLLNVICVGEQFEVQLSQMSELSRFMGAQSARVATPSSPVISRKKFPEQDPHVCLAFLSCCGRTDLLNHTIAAAIRHMEEDEPNHLRYEIAWVDNGSDIDLTNKILESFQIEQALPLEKNTGLAYGMNLLIRNLCTAPYILLLEEDWLYLDDIVADQTPRRKAAIATAIAFTEMNQTAYDGRQVMGVFLRPETYSSFMKFPFLDIWQEVDVDLMNLPSNSQENDCNSDSMVDKINYLIACADSSTNSKYIWGSYTNGAGLYRRSSLIDNGRMYGEPGDAFHDRYVESNYAYRVGLKYCHAAIQLGDCQDLSSKECTAAFYHIGGGRGTRPMKVSDSKCTTYLWNFVGTPIFHRYLKLMGEESGMCSMEEIEDFKQLRAKEEDAIKYRKEVEETSKVLFEKQRTERDKMLEQARIIRQTDNDQIRRHVTWMSEFTDEQIEAEANKLERLARSPHPLEGYYDSHGRPLK
mmetsp:Transcript_11864/g.18201  ORF Transcript_11864/g.18201 Transcript_11864/m.18201 type:complete len:498 (-) Transcript_11864:110-1603(-)